MWLRIISHFTHLIFLLFFNGCMEINHETPNSEDCRTITHAFFKLSYDDQLRSFKNLKLEDQYKTYICGMRNIHPSTIYLAEELAQQGKVAFPLLAEKARITKSDANFRDILQVFSMMQKMKTYDVKSEHDLMKSIKLRAASMPDKFWRDHTNAIIFEISNSK